jgi:hypothetical protein
VGRSTGRDNIGSGGTLNEKEFIRKGGGESLDGKEEYEDREEGITKEKGEGKEVDRGI